MSKVSRVPDEVVCDPDGAFPGTPDLMLAVVAASSNAPVVPVLDDDSVEPVVPRPCELKGCSFTALRCPVPEVELPYPAVDVGSVEVESGPSPVARPFSK